MMRKVKVLIDKAAPVQRQEVTMDTIKSIFKPTKAEWKLIKGWMNMIVKE